jgi:hypothetical protein
VCACVYTHNGVFFNFKKKKILIHATKCMDIEDIMLSEISQLSEDSVYMY